MDLQASLANRVLLRRRGLVNAVRALLIDLSKLSSYQTRAKAAAVGATTRTEKANPRIDVLRVLL